jgi:hypothetical protein
MTEVPKIGSLIPANENPGRDAIHIAIAPVVAGAPLSPGERVVLYSVDGRIYPCEPRNPGAIGIVDPYLVDDVKEGEKVYLFLLPSSITSLRHVWTHPAFVPRLPPRPVLKVEDEGKESRNE